MDENKELRGGIRDQLGQTYWKTFNEPEQPLGGFIAIRHGFT